MSKIQKPAAWQVRKIAYGLAAVVVGVLGWAGVLSELSADQITGQADQWLPIILAVLGLGAASAKTNPGSDSTVTVADVAAAQVSAEAVAEAVSRRLAGAASHGAHAADAAADAIGAYVRSVRGE